MVFTLSFCFQEAVMIGQRGRWAYHLATQWSCLTKAAMASSCQPPRLSQLAVRPLLAWRPWCGSSSGLVGFEFMSTMFFIPAIFLGHSVGGGYIQMHCNSVSILSYYYLKKTNTAPWKIIFQTFICAPCRTTMTHCQVRAYSLLRLQWHPWGLAKVSL